jgi:hypothetical protein
VRGAAAVDARTLAVITGGAIDAIVAEGLHDPAFRTMPAATGLGLLRPRAPNGGLGPVGVVKWGIRTESEVVRLCRSWTGQGRLRGGLRASYRGDR